MPDDYNALLDRLSKLEALFARAGTLGEKDAAGSAIGRLQQRLKKTDEPVELQFSLPDIWSVRLFIAVCRKHDVKPYRYPRQRRTTVMARAPKTMLEDVIWAEFSSLQKELEVYFEDTVEHLISSVMHADGDDSDLTARQLPGK